MDLPRDKQTNTVDPPRGGDARGDIYLDITHVQNGISVPVTKQF